MSASPDSHMNDLPGTIWDASSINQFAWCNFKLGTMSHKIMTPKCKLLKVTYTTSQMENVFFKAVYQFPVFI